MHYQPLVEVSFQVDQLVDDVDIVQAQQTRPNQGTSHHPGDESGDCQDVQDFDQAIEIHGLLPMIVVVVFCKKYS